MIANENSLADAKKTRWAAGNNSRQNLFVHGIVDNGDNENGDSGQR